MTNIPNLITFLRLLLVAPINWYLLNGQFGIALLLFAVAALTDLLDGQLARSFNLESRLGSILDPVADKVLVVTTFVSLWIMGMLPTWVTLLVIARDLVVIIGAATYHYLRGQYTLRPLISSKLNTVLQLLLLVCTLGIPLLVDNALFLEVQFYLILAVTVTSVISCLQYIVYSFTKGW